jgi:phosphoserine phosphatase
MRKNVMGAALLDVDGTLYPRSIGLALLDAMMKRGLGQVARIADVIAAVQRFRAGEIEFVAMVELTSAAYAAALAGVEKVEVEALAREIWPGLREGLFDFVRPLIAQLRAKDMIPYIVSSSPAEVVALLAEELGVADHDGSRFAVVDGRYTGECLLMPGAPGGKISLLRAFAVRHGAELRRSLVLGNGEGDLEALAEVGHALLFEAKPALQAHGAARGWALVDRGDLLDRVRRIEPLSRLNP